LTIYTNTSLMESLTGFSKPQFLIFFLHIRTYKPQIVNIKNVIYLNHASASQHLIYRDAQST